MKNHYFIGILLLLVACKKETTQTKEDFREPYSGLFNFTSTKNTIVMCNDSRYGYTIGSYDKYEITGIRQE